MVNETLEYPIYRKYVGDRSFFKIDSPKSFEEIQIMGSRLFKYQVLAKTLPDFHLINDMIQKENDHWVEASKEEFDNANKRYQMQII